MAIEQCPPMFDSWRSNRLLGDGDTSFFFDLLAPAALVADIRMLVWLLVWQDVELGEPCFGKWDRLRSDELISRGPLTLLKTQPANCWKLSKNVSYKPANTSHNKPSKLIKNFPQLQVPNQLLTKRHQLTMISATSQRSDISHSQLETSSQKLTYFLKVELSKCQWTLANVSECLRKPL